MVEPNKDKSQSEAQPQHRVAGKPRNPEEIERQKAPDVNNSNIGNIHYRFGNEGRLSLSSGGAQEVVPPLIKLQHFFICFDVLVLVLELHSCCCVISLLPATCYLLPATCYLLPATCYLLPATCYLLPATASPHISSGPIHIHWHLPLALVLPMGWKNSPPVFLTATETIANLLTNRIDY